MYKILIVDDNPEKIRRISSSIESIEGIDLNSIEHLLDARSAKLSLQSKCFDLLVLDIAIPSRIDEKVKKNAGLELLEELFERDIYKIPTDIICVTAYEDILKEKKDYFDKNLLTTLYCDQTSDNWLDQIKMKISRKMAAKNSQRYARKDFESFCAIVCALETPELHAVLRNGWNWEKLFIENDATTYYKSTIRKSDTDCICYAAAAPRKGMPATAVLTTKMISTFRPRNIVMTGITSGRKEKNKFGDIIAADPVWDWGSGKIIEINGDTSFEPEPHQLDLDVEIRNKLKSMAQEKVVFSNIKDSWDSDSPEHELSMYVGPLVSGAAVLADSNTRKIIYQQHRGILGVDMETYSVFASAQESTIPHPTVFTMKSVVDFADLEKNDKFHRYAAFTSAQAAKYFIENYL
jgi:nucleoside phosphorylase/CheY-like chemotaxis protein